MPPAFAGARPAARCKTEHHKPGDAARRLARRVQVGTEEETGQEGRRNYKRETGQDFEARCGAWRCCRPPVQERPQKPNRNSMYTYVSLRCQQAIIACL